MQKPPFSFWTGSQKAISYKYVNVIRYADDVPLPPLAVLTFSWYCLNMEPTPFEFTPAQKGLLESLSRETGQPVSALIDKALERLEEHVRHANGEAHDSDEEAPPITPQKPRKPSWKLFEEASRKIPDEELDRLPTDLAAQVDHYLYGTPKR
jgi:Ribbon-helix-helix domain